MHTLHSSLYALVLAVCVLCFFIARGVNGQRLTYFLVFLVLEAVRFKLEWLMLHPTLFGKPLWLGLLLASSLFVAPCLWLLTREVTEDVTPPWHSLPASHMLIIVVGILFTLPLISTVHWGSTFANPGSSLTTLELRVIQGGMFITAVLFLAQVPFYGLRCIRLIRQQVTQARVLFADFESTRVNALRLLIVVVGIQWGVSFLRVLHCIFLGEDTSLGVFFAAVQVGVTLWALVEVMKKTTVFSADDRRFLRELTVTGVEEVQAPAQYVKSSLTEGVRQRVTRKLKKALEEEYLYRDGALNLRGLCNHIDENPHYVSQIISQDFNTNFYELINRYRIEETKQILMLKPMMPVVEVAMAVGFNSKSTFNAAFRRHTHTTPTEFRNSHLDPPQSLSVDIIQ